MLAYQYLVFYKPFQVLSQFSKEGEKQTLADFLPNIEKNIYPVGRLDYDSEGLLFLTNDPSINNKLLNPKFKHQKTYWAQVEGLVNDKAIAQLQQGVNISINGKKHLTLPAIVKILEAPNSLPERNPPIRFRKNIPTSWLAITIAEGKNRQVRKMTAAVGLPTLRLIRNSIGKVFLKDLNPGEYKMLDAKDLHLLFEK